MVLRRSPIQVRTRLERRGKLPPVNKERLAKRREKDTCPAHRDRLQRRRCDGIWLPDGRVYHAELCPERGLLNVEYRCDGSHVKTKGSGGLWWAQVSHSRFCHSEFEQLPPWLKRRMLPLALELAQESHQLMPDRVPAPPLTSDTGLW